MRDTHLLVSCEHGGNRVPARYRHLFAGHEAHLGTHRGYDPGALALARDLAERLGATCFVSTVSRLLVDLNRSIGHPKLYSEATRVAPPALRREILDAHYLPYRNAVHAHVADAVAHGARVIHISSHSFTPVLDGITRDADIGLLYDPGRPGEATLCQRWQAALAAALPAFRVRRNYPYTGKSDGLTAYLRRHYNANVYVGVEFEINQKHVRPAGQWRGLRPAIVDALVAALDAAPLSPSPLKVDIAILP